MSEENDTVYINDNPIGETEVYHDKKSHASTLRSHRRDFTKEVPIEEARERGLRPCKQCFPTNGNDCPACGFRAVEEVAPGSVRCPNDGCRVQAFRTEEDKNE